MNTLQDTSRDNKPKKIKRVGLHIDMTPMVDVAMLLLTFFMLTTVFNKPQAIELMMPESKDSVRVDERKLITLFVDGRSLIFTQRGGSENILPVSLNQLRNELTDLKKNIPDAIALIKIDRQARYERMVDLLDELHYTSIDRFSITPLPERESLKLQNISPISEGTL